MSEITNIPLGGVSNEPNDYGTEEGALSLSLNAVKHHGSIRPVMPGSPVEDIGQLPEGTDVLAIHEVGGMKHYILQQELEGAVQEEMPAAAHTAEVPAMMSMRSTTTGGTFTIYAVCLPEGVEVTVRTDRPGIGKATILLGQEMQDIAIGDTILFDSGWLPLSQTRVYRYPDVLPTEEDILAGYFTQEDFVTEATGEWAIKRYVIDGGKATRKKVEVNVTCNENGVEVSPSWSSVAIDAIKLRIGSAQYLEQSLSSGEIASWPASSVYIGKTGSGLMSYQHPNAVLAAYMVQVMYAALDGTIIPLETFLEKHKVQVNITVTEPTTPPDDGEDDGEDDGGEGGDEEPSHTVFFQNRTNDVKIWWQPYPEDFSTSRGLSFEAIIGPDGHTHAVVLVPNVAQIIPGSEVCVGIDGSEPVMYDYANGKVLSAEDITAVWRDMYDNITPIANLRIEEVLDQSGGDDNGGEGGNEGDDNNEGGNEDGRYGLFYKAASPGSQPILIGRFAEPVMSVTPMGNVLTVATKGKPLSYIIWKDEDYHVLGSEVDAPRVYPYLMSKTVGLADLYSLFGASFTNDAANTNLMQDESASTTVWTPLVKNEAKYITFNAEHQKFVSDKVFALVNSAHRILMQKGYFYAPFFVRFAFRMFDGNHILHTAPQLMIAGAAGKPLLAVDITSPGEEDGAKVKNVDLSPLFVASRLFAEVSPIGTTWDGLITHLDVFVSPPLINYSDDTAAIKAVGITKNTAQSDQINAPADIMPAFDGRYMKNRKLMGNIFDEDEDSTSPSSYIRMRRSTWKIHHVYNRFDDPEDPIFLIDTIAYPAIVAGQFIAGAPTIDFPLKDAFDDLEIGETKDGEKIYLKDTGLTNLSSYKYFKWNDIYYNGVFFEGPYETFQMIRVWCEAPGEKTDPKYSLELQRTDSQSYITDIKDNNLFRLVQSIPMERLSGGWKGDLNIEEYTLTGADNAETLPDNGQMRNRVTTDIAPFAYNSRLSIAASTWELPSMPAIADFCVQNEPEDGKGYYIEKAWIKALVNGQVAYKRLEIGKDGDKYTYAENIRYFYYPCYEATHLILQVLQETAKDGKPYKVMEFALDKHKLLNGAYLFNNFDTISPTKTHSYTTKEEMMEDELLKNAMSGSPSIAYGNMVRVSGVGNPFYFNEVNQVQLPSGKISGLSTTAKALSQGQFGAFPLYCFSDNGIWALEVSDTGTYSAKQPVSRAVCTNPESITQTEGSVLFVTKRGLMALDGSSVTCVSEILSGHNYTSALSKLDKVKALAGLQDVPNPDTHIEEWLQDARLLYDDKRQMIYAFNGEDVLGYVYSISDQAWGMMVHDLDHPLPCYTDALAVTREDEEGKRKLVNMSDHTRCGDAPKAVLVTRPLTFGSADAYKSIEALTLRGMLDKDDAKLVIWASNDLKHWAVAASSQTSWYRGKSGTPYKYYRIGIVLDWEEEDSLSAIGADTTTRLTNRIR